MEIANGLVILSPENQQHKLGVTPAEALILYRMHRTNANGNPLGDFYIQEGEALTIDTEGRPAEEEYFNQTTGRHVGAKPAVPAVTHKRTQQEEIERLRRKYTGLIRRGGQDIPAFVAVFGDSMTLTLPEKFSDIEVLTGHIFHPAGSEPQLDSSPEAGHRKALLAMKRPELCALAVDTYKLKVKVTDSNEDIAEDIIEAIKEKTEKAKGEKASE